MGISVGGASGSSSVQDTPSDDEVGKSAKAQGPQEIDQSQIADKDDQAQALLGQGPNAQAQLQSIQAFQQGGPGAVAELEKLDGPTRTRVDQIAKDVVAQLMQSINAGPPKLQASMTSEGDGQQQQGQGGGPNSMTSNMLGNTQQEAADQQIQEAAKVAVYRDITDMLTGMNDKRIVKDNIRNAESTLNAIIAKHKPGDPAFNIPNYVFDEKTGQLTQKGTRKVTYEEAVAARDKLKDTRDSISEMSEMDTLKLQQMMEKKGQLESMISNCIKSTGDTANNLAAALKA